MTAEGHRRGSERLPCSRWICLLIVVFLSGSVRAERIGPWDTDALFQPPRTEWGETKEGVREVYYEGEPFQGHPTRVYAVYAQPDGEGPFPAMVCVHGGGGTAFPEWVRLWAARGYAALAMDLAGCGPQRKRLPDGGPNQTDEFKFREFDESTVTDMWSYHAVATVIRGHSLLRQLPQIDSNRIGVTGISWGGYLTCIVAGVDHRFALAIPVYGCGFLHHNSVWLPRFEKMSPSQRDLWVRYFDPSNYLARVKCPIFFLNGTNDFAYPLDSYRKSFDVVPGNKLIRIEVRMKHSHPDGWAPQEIGLFADSLLKAGVPLTRLTPIHREGRQVWCEIITSTAVREAHLNFTTDSGRWQDRHWQTLPARLEGHRIAAELPDPEPTAFYFDVIDERNAMTSTPPEILQ
ncbi:MAG: alpha/beta hydrolase family protein [Thermogutta sp.]